MDKTYIIKGQTSKVESFMERICEENHLYNYMGAIDMALERALAIVDDDVVLSFSHVKDGVCLGVATNEDKFSKIGFSDTTNANFEDLYLLKNLADSIEISADGKNMELFFATHGVEEELVMSRKEKLKAYCFHKNNCCSIK